MVSPRPFQEIVGRAGPLSVIALINAAEMTHAADIPGGWGGVIYRKDPNWRTAQIRKQEFREKLGFGDSGRRTQPKDNGH